MILLEGQLLLWTLPSLRFLSLFQNFWVFFNQPLAKHLVQEELTSVYGRSFCKHRRQEEPPRLSTHSQPWGSMVSLGAFRGVWTHRGPWVLTEEEVPLSGNIIKLLDQCKVKELCKVKSSANTHHTSGLAKKCVRVFPCNASILI